MKVYVLQRIQRIPAELDTVWQFFADPGNLPLITPPYMRFRILSPAKPERMYAGQIITYHVRPLLGIPLFWMTEITHVAEKQYFIDEQRMGPYAFWHHQHHFREIPGGVEMTDIVHYRLPLGLIGRMAHAWHIRQQLQEIFDYRFQRVEERFGKFTERNL
ncbi:SRPBCC family protein [Thermoflavifilum thermophilum]|uniref:Ligand-binding SRPBCC domain-containing protein n=1 Tax=Thermoflavifilum thermophilum TaxID=1393122 RepID=A0A1I7N9D9_9BACT|nr:SRPBCC family protein [Thermoflavifilum thermophilum]SFV31292.1 Ligand-binding SRPBCC domain-containing protein [Thermoflavifilum thermophilum]